MPETDDQVEDTLDESQRKFTAFAFPYEKFLSPDSISKAVEEHMCLGQSEHPTRKKDQA